MKKLEKELVCNHVCCFPSVAKKPFSDKKKSINELALCYCAHTRKKRGAGGVLLIAGGGGSGGRGRGTGDAYCSTHTCVSCSHTNTLIRVHKLFRKQVTRTYPVIQSSNNPMAISSSCAYFVLSLKKIFIHFKSM